MTESTSERVRLPWSRSCFVCGEANPQGLRAEIFLVGDVVEMTFVPRREHVGWNNVVHGGLVSTVLDELMTWAAIIHGRQAYFAVDFGVRFKAPLPAEKPCLVKARASGSRRRVVDTEAWIEDEAGTVFARGTGRYLPVPPAKVPGFHDDFVWADGCLDLREVFGIER